MEIIRAILCVLLPPLAVIDKGIMVFLLVCVLTLFGWIPGMIAAIIFSSGMTFLRALACVLLPPLGVYDCGLGPILVVIVLTLLGWIPGIIGALLFVMMKKVIEKEKQRW
jgi:uncharacterized membrane protein YqaE (UPF0057 family)